MNKYSPKTEQFDALHGLRGLAALCVMVAHFSWLTGRNFAPQSHTAVDMFFLLSGFVIAHAYDSRLSAGMTFTQFSRARLIRLYPLYLLSLLLGLAAVPIVFWLGISSGYSRVSTLISFFFGLLFVPTAPHWSADNSLFPLVGPAWSLFWELVANAVFAATALFLTRRVLLAVLLVGAIAVALTAWDRNGLSDGAYWSVWSAGAARVSFSFFLGIYLRRHHFSADPQKTSGRLAFVVLVLCALTLLLVRPPEEYKWFVDLTTVFIAWPMIILSGARIRLEGFPKKFAHLSGEASYGIYVLHISLIALIVGSYCKIAHVVPKELSIAGVAIISTGIVATAIAANFWYDRPVRAWLNRTPRSPEQDVTQF